MPPTGRYPITISNQFPFESVLPFEIELALLFTDLVVQIGPYLLGQGLEEL